MIMLLLMLVVMLMQIMFLRVSAGRLTTAVHHMRMDIAESVERRSGREAILLLQQMVGGRINEGGNMEVLEVYRRSREGRVVLVVILVALNVHGPSSVGVKIVIFVVDRRVVINRLLVKGLKCLAVLGVILLLQLLWLLLVWRIILSKVF